MLEEIGTGRSPAWHETPGVGPSLPRVVHRCLEEVWKRTGLRARLFLLESGDLVLRACVGGYQGCPETGLKVHPESVVWEVFETGQPENLTDPCRTQLRAHTLPSPVFLKAVIPLCATSEAGEIVKLGALVVDAGASGEPIQERDFHYLQLVASLMAETLRSLVLMKRIRTKEMEKDKMAQEVSHIFRNRLTVIGGFARRLARGLWSAEAKKWAEIIREEVAAAEQALEDWRKTHWREEPYEEQ